jgi:hypothetical protein
MIVRHLRKERASMKVMKLAAALFFTSSLVLAGVTQIAGQPRGQRPWDRKQAVWPKLELVKEFDKDGDGRLNSAERHAAMEYLDANPGLRRKGRGPLGGPKPPPPPGPKLTPADVKSYPASVSLFDPNTLRTLFLQFEDADWEKQLAAFHRSDVLVPAKLVVDGKTYRDVGVHFRGNNSFSMVSDGWKRSITLAFDFVHPKQNVNGYRGLHLLNCNQDPTMLRSVLYCEVARHYFPAPKANFMRVVINGESWGVYANQQKFDKEFVRDFFHTTKGTRWRSPNNSRGGGFGYLGDDVAVYKRWYALKSKDDPKAWADLAHLCKVIDQTPPEQLAKALEPILDLNNVLAFLALDYTLINNDGYWNDGSDFAVYQDVKRRFHLLPHDANEGFRPAGRSGAGVKLDPFVATNDVNKALRHKLLAVPELRTRYLRYVQDIAENWLDWKKLGPIVEKYRTAIEADVKTDTHKHFSTAEFTTSVYGPGDGSPPPASTLKGFCEQRRAYLLNHPDIKKLTSQTP